MQITRDNYLRLKRLMIEELIDDINSDYQLGTDQISNIKRRTDYQQLLQVLGCFSDNDAIYDVQRAQHVFKQSHNEDAEDQIESWLDRANLD